ncbi:MAG: NAD/NADP octopine/nopaline dehydrogenase family protein, partial [Rhodospirillales bacterium]|nr:NAD/NADP octopine/nopaline dehydrogenase family protein [Rhodospirillales bacterium]
KLEIAVIGGGHGCYAAAVSLTEQGHNIRLWRRDAAAFGAIRDTRTLKLTDHKGTRDIEISVVIDDLAAAIDGAELVLLPLPCHTHRSLAPQLAPLWQEGQVGYLPPGTFGGYIYAKAAVDAGNTANIAFGETGTLPYLARKHGEDNVRISVYATRLPTGIYPLKDAERAFAVIKQAFPAAEQITDLLDGALMNAGPIIHPPLIMMNAGPLEHFDAWDIHNEGTQASIRSVTDALDDERISLREALGYSAPHFPLKDHYDDDREEWMYGNSSHEKLTDSTDWREKIDLHTHRYMREDTALGLAFYVSIGRWVNHPMPISEGLLAIATGITGDPLYESGRSLESLGLADLSLDEMRDMLTNGIAT